MKKMSKEDKEFFQKAGFIKGPAKSHNLVYLLGNKTETILEGKDYALCNYKKEELEKLPQYQKGQLIIKPNN